jgi:hypothetical protein
MASGIDEKTEFVAIEDHLRALWQRMSNIREKIISLPPECDRWLVGVAHFDQYNEPLSLSGGHFATARYYRLRMDFDFYFDDSFGNDDECERRYWDWQN